MGKNMFSLSFRNNKQIEQLKMGAIQITKSYS